jgi:hypothetical protein
MIILTKALSLAILSVKVRREDLTLNDIIVRLTAIQSIADVPLPWDEAASIIEEDRLEDELLRQRCAELGMLISWPASTAHH